MTRLKSKRDNDNSRKYITRIESEINYINTSGDKVNGDLEMQNQKI